jgi:exoribonuclease R
MLHTSNYQNFEIIAPGADTVLHSFTGPEKAGRALPGDFVEWMPAEERCALINRTIHAPLTGLLDVCSKTIYGMTSRHVPIFLFYPYDKRFPPMRVGCSTVDRSCNLLVTVRFDDWPVGETFPRANLETVIGPVGDVLIETKALVSYASPYWRSKPTYTAPVAAESKHTSLPSYEPAPWHVFHIDPAGCRDVDDVVGFQERADGRTNLLIGIADVAAFVAADSTLDKIAFHNTSTVYSLGGTALRPMFPAALSEGVFSLLPDGSEKLIVGLTCIYDGNMLTNISFGQYKTTVHKTYSYEEAATDERLQQLLGGVAATIARRIAGSESILNVAEISRDSHCWIEQLMIFYNMEAAAQLAEAGTGIFREHEAVRPEQLDAVRLLPADLQWVAANPAAYTFAGNSTHSAAGAQAYCHATSPIRRYVDLYNQRALKAILTDCLPPSRNPYIVRHLNARQKVMKKYQRTLTFITNLLGGDAMNRAITATVVCVGDTKARLWIHEWKTLVNTIEYDGLSIGDTVGLRFYYNPNRPNWKERIVFERQ